MMWYDRVDMETIPEFDADRIFAILGAGEMPDDPPPAEGLRERKKRRLRQRISNIATALFLTEGFEDVSVARIAERAEVSEQTVFNYFPTKESMFFDRADELTRTIAAAVRDPSRGPLSEALWPALTGPSLPERWPPSLEERDGLALLRRFSEVATTSPTLRAAPYLAMGPFVDTVTGALAERQGRLPEDPDVRMIAMTIAGLVFIRQESFRTHAQAATSVTELERAIERDVARAIAIARPSLDAFDAAAAVEQGSTVPAGIQPSGDAVLSSPPTSTPAT
jgi:AcrR family transcriptional regulator